MLGEVDQHRNDVFALCKALWTLNHQYAVRLIKSLEVGILLFYEQVIPNNYRADLSIRVEVPVDKTFADKGQCYPPTTSLIEAKQDIFHCIRRKAGFYDESATNDLNFSNVSDADLDARIDMHQPYSPTYRRLLEHLQFLAFEPNDTDELARRVFYTEALLDKVIGADGVPVSNYAEIIETTSLDELDQQMSTYEHPQPQAHSQSTMEDFMHATAEDKSSVDAQSVPMDSGGDTGDAMEEVDEEDDA